MALADVLDRILADAQSEAQAVTDEATAQAAGLMDAARERAEKRSARTLADAERDARRQAQTIAAGARLEARDAALAAKGALIERALAGVREHLAALPPGEYAAFLAREIVAAARGDERVLVAPDDRERLAGLAAAVKAEAASAGRQISLTFSDEPAPVAHGVVLRGERDSVDLSVAGIVEARKDALSMRLASALFDDGKDA